jgi:hypothetical protein
MHLLNTNLVRIDGGHALIEGLKKYNIRHLEQLASLLLSHTGRNGLEQMFPEIKPSSIETAIAAQLASLNIRGLRLGADAAEASTRLSTAFSRRGYGMAHFSVKRRNEAGTYELLGPIPATAVVPNSDDNHVTTAFRDFLAESTPALSPAVRFALHPQGQFPHPRDQGSRGTCVAFALNAMLAIYIDEHVQNFARVTDFSPQYLYYRAKRLDPRHDEEGTTLEYGLQALRDYGVCAENVLPYAITSIGLTAFCSRIRSVWTVFTNSLGELGSPTISISRSMA